MCLQDGFSLSEKSFSNDLWQFCLMTQCRNVEWKVLFLRSYTVKFSAYVSEKISFFFFVHGHARDKINRYYPTSASEDAVVNCIFSWEINQRKKKRGIITSLFCFFPAPILVSYEDISMEEILWVSRNRYDNSAAINVESNPIRYGCSLQSNQGWILITTSEDTATPHLPYVCFYALSAEWTCCCGISVICLCSFHFFFFLFCSQSTWTIIN